MPQLNIRRAEAELTDGNPRNLAQRARRYAGQVSTELQRIRAIIDAVREEYRERWECWNGVPMPDGTQPRLDMVDARNTAVFIAAAFIAFTLESTVASYLSIFLLALATSYAVTFGLATVAALGAIARAVVATMNDVERPRNSRDRVRRWAGGWSAVAISAIAMFYGARGIPALAFTVTWSLTVQALSLPMAGAAWLELAAQTDTRNRLGRQFRRLSRRLLDLERFDSVLQGVIAVDTPPTPPNGGNQAVTEKPKTPYMGPLMSVLVAGLLLFGTVTADAAMMPCQIAVGIDVSGSLEPRECQRVLSSLATSMPHAVELMIDQLKSITIKQWAAGPQLGGGPDLIVTLPRLPSLTMPPLIPDEQWIIANTGDLKRAEWRKTCESRRDEALRDYRARVATSLATVHDTLETINPQKQAPATCIDQALTRFFQLRGHVLSIIVSDGQQANCPSPARKDQLALADTDAGVVLVLLPARTDGNAVMARMAARAARLTARFPRLRVVQSYDIIDDDSWHRALGVEASTTDLAQAVIDCSNPPTAMLNPTSWTRP